MLKEIKHEKAVRKTFSKIGDSIEMPNLIQVQKDSYNWFVEEGLGEVLKDISPIIDYTGNLVLEFFDYYMEDKTKYTQEEAKERDTTYSTRLHVKVRLINRETGEIKEQEIYLGDFPLMTESGTFIINGAERVVVSQLVRSPGCYYAADFDKTGKKIYTSTVMPIRGAWIEYETDSNDIVNVRVDRTRKLPVTSLLRAIGIETDEQIISLFGEEDKLVATINKDTVKTQDEALIEIYKKLRPGELPTVDAAKNLFNGLFFDHRRYDLSKVGRFKFNQKLSLANRITGKISYDDIIDPTTGEVLVEKDTEISEDVARAIQDTGINIVDLKVNDKKVRVIGNGTVNIYKYLPDVDLSKLHFKEDVNYEVLKSIVDTTEPEKLVKVLGQREEELIPKHVTTEDMIASVSYLLGLDHGLGEIDDIDHLGNRRIRCVGELLQNQFRIGLTRLERAVRERMTTQDLDVVTPQTLINTKPITSSIREFFGSSQLSQFMDQTNPLSELTHKRRISALGPGGLTRERAGFEVRDIHHTHYGRLCPVESPEGPNIGLISALSCFAQINEYGFVETPYKKVDKETGKVTDTIEFMSADVEDKYIIAQATEPLDKDGKFVNDRIRARYREEILEVDKSKVDYIDVSPKQLVSVAAAMIPFVEHDDVKRSLMGSNMQRQAVPLLMPEAPIVGTGLEYRAAKDSGITVVAENEGIVERVSGDEITVRNKNNELDKYKLRKFKRTNGGTCINQRPIVSKGEKVKKGDILADGPSTKDGEMSLGKNVIIAFMTWEGYNYEDAILLSERLVKEDVYTSIHIEEYDCECRDTKLGPEEITRDIPNVGEDGLKDLDEDGIIRIGAEVRPGDILVGKVTPKGETELTAEERLLRAIFGEKAREVRDTSLRVPHGEAGTIVDVKIFTRENSDELGPGVNQVIRCYIATKRKISVGDKMSGRHGNKGVISRILPEEDMPFMEDGTPVDIVLNPQGIPSRMNVGQVLEVHLGMAAKALGFKVETPVFDGAKSEEIEDLLEKAGLSRDGKRWLRDGRTGELFDNPITVGVMYMLKLHHLVDDKIHARSTGPYSLVTQQPLGGKAQFGGQRFGEMEVWALEAYGAAYTLQEMLTVKSDDVVGRVKTYEAIVKGENIPTPGVPESFKVLVKELQSLGLDLRLYTKDNVELELKENIEDGIDFNIEDNKKQLGETVADESEIKDNYIEADEESESEDSDDLFTMSDEDMGDVDSELYDEDEAFDDMDESFEDDMMDEDFGEDE
ncbi:MAG: DNA-directed RNA polymerase subunit beta [Bacilli bacterium]|nr:DNA-directed RNA polymerase subunit beta [Clostridia bacterium]MBR3490268.1 DNA-directed RNA polymerase subunit beta [Bacilli bacterium]